MKIAVMGTGGVGGYFGGLLAKAGEDVTFIARGAHLDAIRSKGLRVVSDLSGEFIVRSNATDDTKSVGPVDLVLYTVKMYHNDEAIPAIVPMVGEQTVVLTLQNGIDNGDRLAAALGENHVMIGTAGVQTRIMEPGVVRQLGQFGRIAFGEMSRGITPRCERMLDVFRKGGWNVELSENALGALWRKFIFITASAGVNAVTQVPYGEMRSVPETRELIISAYREITDVGRASGASLGDDVLEFCVSTLDGFAGNGMSSLANDFKAGNRTELEGLTGTAVRIGEKLGVSTPINSAIYALLKPAALRIEMLRSST